MNPLAIIIPEFLNHQILLNLTAMGSDISISVSHECFQTKGFLYNQ